MKILNLVYPEKSEIKYKISKFPSGQQNIIVDREDLKTVNFGNITKDRVIQFYDFSESIEIKSRLNNWLDLELIICTVTSLREVGVEEIHLYVPFIDGRQDRKFEEGGNNYLRDVLAPVVNSLKFKSVTVLDPHSYVLEACLNNFKSVNNHGLVGYALDDLKYDRDSDRFILVSPDAGASKKIYKLAEQIDYKEDIITCSKERDNTGELTKTIFPYHGDNTKDFIIVDDICDGGKTFINIAEKIKEYFNHKDFDGAKSPKIYLIVTHGIFSKKMGVIAREFDGVYCTNSYSDINKTDAESFIIGKENFKFNQLNIF